jgi:hypothetical protein
MQVRSEYLTAILTPREVAIQHVPRDLHAHCIYVLHLQLFLIDAVQQRTCEVFYQSFALNPSLLIHSMGRRVAVKSV